MRYLKGALIAFLIIIGLVLRLVNIKRPIADWHSHRQADTASVTREYLKQGINIWVPKYHDLSDVQSGQENPLGLRMVEFPFYNLMGIEFYRAYGDLGLRILSVLISIINCWLVYQVGSIITKNKQTALSACFFYWLMPFNIFYSSAILPDNLAVTGMLLGLWLFKNRWLLAAVFFSCSVLIKPFVGFIVGPIMFYWLLSDLRKWWKYLLTGLIVLLAFWAWRNWVDNFPAGVPANAWLLNNSDNAFFPEWYKGINLTWLNKLVALRPSWWYWLFLERLSKLLMGGFGLFFLIIGLAWKNDKWQKNAYLMLVGIGIYFLIVAQGNIRHDYYQILITPFLAIIAGVGVYFSYKYLWKNILLVSLCLILAWGLSWYQVKDFYKIGNPNIVEAGKKVDSIVPDNAYVIAPNMGDTSFLYQTNRRGWPVEIYDIEDMIKKYDKKPIFFVSTNYDQYTNKMMEKYNTVYRDDKFIILEINK